MTTISHTDPPDFGHGMASNPRGWTKEPTVYVIQDDPTKNFTSALKYGSVEPLLQHREEPNMINIPTIVERLRYGLRNFSRHDFLVLIGSPAAIGIACAIAADITGGEFNILKWDTQERRYWKGKVNIKQGV